jgi:hypothetical protein
MQKTAHFSERFFVFRLRRGFADRGVMNMACLAGG